ncbi:MAG: HEAT repeat domain-containing protein [Candidatus Kapabacteria bacterium]|nr:HEAT repeat domain-containing protein [Candidatus Kapabacteria bacterium]
MHPHIRVPVVLAVATLLSLGTATAQWSWPTVAVRAVDSALFALGMSRQDLAMPPDLLPADVHRLPVHDISFSDPLRPFDELESIRGHAAGRKSDAMDSIVAWSMSRMGLGEFRRHRYELTMTANELAGRLGTDPERAAGFIGATFLKRYIAACLIAADSTKAARTGFLSQRLLVDMCDSLWMNSTESETASLWQLHDDEVRSQERTRAFMNKANPRSMTSVYQHGWSLYQELLEYVAQFDRASDVLRDSVKTVILHTPAGRVALGGSGNDTYTGTFLLIVDIGGNDTYQLSDTEKDTALAYGVRCIVDFDGDDAYLASDYDLGSGLGGIGIVIDRNGNDTYRADDQSLGCGIFGVGIVHDLAGNDSYLGGQNTQGCGIFGLGLLLDDGGFDLYRSHAQAQGFGGTRGVGILSDRSGNDTYLAISPYVDVLRYEAHHVTFTQGAALGIRPIASGGIGLLLDHGGNDQYSTDIYGQGTAYWYGLGALIDDDGEDRYQAYQYAQGSGVHFAWGALRDRAGDDVYVSHGVSQGCGHDVATGTLIDEAGNDSYTCESLSLGGGNANAVSILVDAAGNDAYVASNTQNTMGFSDYRRGYGMIGLFVDAAGTDTYGSTTRNASVSLKSTYGVFADLELTATAAGETPAQTTAPTTVSEPLRSSVDSLMVQASAAPLRYQSNVKPARTKLAAMGASALPGLAAYLGTQMPRERLALEEVIPQIYAASPTAVRQLLSDSMSSKSTVTQSTVLTLAGKVMDTVLIPAIGALTTGSRWQQRRNAIHALQEIGNASALPFFVEALRDTHAYVRARSAFAVGSLGGAPAFALLREALLDDDQMVRFAAIEGLNRGSRRKASDLVSWWRGRLDRRIITSGLRLLAAADTSKADVKAITSWYRSASAWQRSSMERLLPSMPAFWQRQLAAGTGERRRSAASRRTRKSEPTP